MSKGYNSDGSDSSEPPTPGTASGNAPAVTDQPLLAINECIRPETWLNIPGCLVNAFEHDISNQLYLERLSH